MLKQSYDVGSVISPPSGKGWGGCESRYTDPPPAPPGGRGEHHSLGAYRIGAPFIVPALAACAAGLLLCAWLVLGGAAKPALALNNGLARTPPLGWDTYNHYPCNPTEALMKAQADAMVSSGMQNVGYQYVNIDDCWEAANRDGAGNLVADSSRFPDGIAAVAAYVHSKGLKLGIYTDIGTETCFNLPGSYGHEVQDANTFAAWGVDYVKVDWCHTSGLGKSAAQLYVTMRDALNNAARPMVFSICNWGQQAPWDWGPWLGNLWRTTPDISDNWASMLLNLDANNQHAASAGAGGWNDPDMLEVGNGGMSDTEYRAHFSLWAIMAAPLIAGNDLTNMSAATRDTLTNAEVIAVDQDAAGKQGAVARDDGQGRQVWAKQLQIAGQRAVALFNRTSITTTISVNWTNIGLSAGSATVRDLWAHANLGSYTNSYSATVPSHGVVMLLVIGSEPAPAPSPTSCANPFVDITGNVFSGAIAALYCRAAISGTDATHYQPAAVAPRGQFARLIVKGFGLPLLTPTTPTFSDVPPTYFAYPYIETGHTLGILSGYSAAQCTTAGAAYPCYLPNQPITRAEVVRLVVKAAAYSLITPGTPTFVDVPPNNFAYQYIETAAAHGIVRGVDATHFAPNLDVRRDEMAQIVYQGVTTP